jgi:hypothetical protein
MVQIIYDNVHICFVWWLHILLCVDRLVPLIEWKDASFHQESQNWTLTSESIRKENLNIILHNKLGFESCFCWSCLYHGYASLPIIYIHLIMLIGL